MSFWDASAIVPLCINEDRSPKARTLWRLVSTRNIWRETIVEIESTLARLDREGSLDTRIRTKLKGRLALIEKDWKIITPSDRQIELARSFPKQYGLKAMDSLQLAAALTWCNEYPKNKSFVSADTRLLEAANTAGFTVYDLS